MIVIPDLFGAYQKGREAAIQANWNDLANFEKIEAARTANDRANLQALAEMADFNINRNIASNMGDVSQMNTNIAAAQYPADIYNARNNVLLKQSQNSVLQGAANNGTLNTMHGALLGTQANNALTGQATSQQGLMDAQARLGVFEQNYPAYVGSLNNTAQANIGVSDVRAANAVANEQLGQQQYQTGARAGIQTNRNALDYARGAGANNSQYQVGLGTTQATLSSQAAGMAANNAAVQQLANAPQQLADAQRQQLMAQRSQLIEQLAANPNNAGVLAQLNDVEARLGVPLSTPASVTATTMTASGVPVSTTELVANAAGAVPAAAVPPAGSAARTTAHTPNNALLNATQPHVNRADVRNSLLPMPQSRFAYDPSVWASYQAAANYTGP